jgi:hypothetical protein
MKSAPAMGVAGASWGVNHADKNLEVDADMGPAIVPVTITPVTMPPMAMAPAATVDLHDVGRFGVLDAGCLSWQRACTLRDRKQHDGCYTKGGETFEHFYTSFACSSPWFGNTSCPQKFLHNGNVGVPRNMLARRHAREQRLG